MKQLPLSIVFSIIFSVASPGFSMAKPTVDVQVGPTPDYYNQGYWYGPGFYWGVYIDNEDDYWRHYHRRYHGEDWHHHHEHHEHHDDHHHDHHGGHHHH